MYGLKPVPFKAMVLQFGWADARTFQDICTEREGTFNGATDGGNEVSESYGGFAGI